MEIEIKQMQNGAIYASVSDNGRVIFRFDSDTGRAIQAKSLISTMDNFSLNSACSAYTKRTDIKFRIATIEEMQWLELCEREGRTMPKPTITLDYSPIIFN